jgi:hypothetical protein
MIFYGHPANDVSPPAFGIGLPVVIGIGSLLLGVALMLITWTRLPNFFKRRPEVVDPEVLGEPA